MENKVKQSTRILAYLLDILFVYIVLNLVINIKFINPTYDEYIGAREDLLKITENAYTEDADEYLDTIKDMADIFHDLNKYGVVYNIATGIIIIAYFGLFQKFNNGQTLGKKIMKIKVVNNDDSNLTLGKSIIRLIPLQFIYVGGLLPCLVLSIFPFVLNSISFIICYFAFEVLFTIFNIANLLCFLLRKDGLGIHDLIAGTKVVNE